MAIVRIHGVLKEESGIASLMVKGGSIKEVLEKLPEDVKRSMDKYGRYIIVLLNGTRVDENEEIDLKEGDVIDLTLPVGGG